MNRDDFVTRWRARRDELARLGAQVDGAKFCDEVLADVDALLTSEDEALLGAAALVTNDAIRIEDGLDLTLETDRRGRCKAAG